MRRATRLVTLALGLCAAGTADAGAQTTISSPGMGRTRLGNVFWSCARGFFGEEPYEELCGQTFTVPAGDDVLQSFSLELSPVSDARVEFRVYAFAGGVVSGSALYTEAVTLRPSHLNPPVFDTWTFTPPGGLGLTSGRQYAAMLNLITGQQVYAFSGLAGDPYPGGTALHCQLRSTARLCEERNRSGTPFAQPAGDLAFRATFVSSATVVPEPSTWALLGGGLLALRFAGARPTRREG